ncbi:MAG: RNB domain-containing ribonuclease [Gemmatimonadaceae bacterium]
MPTQDSPRIDAAFRRARQELGIRSGFPDDVLREAERVSRERDPAASAAHADRTAIEFVTVDPPGSRDLDQAVQAERQGDGYRVRYAIADVGFWVDRGGALEREAWQRGVTFYAPDCRDPLFPPSLSQGAASLLPDQSSPAVLFDFVLDARAVLVSWTLERALVKSRAQLTYTELYDQATQRAPAGRFAPSWDATLVLLGEIGRKLLVLETERGGVSLPVRDQHVERRAAARLGYDLTYEAPNEAERWNAEVSLLTGHVAAMRMIEGMVGLLRTMPPFDRREVDRFRRIALALGFSWPDGMSYPAFMQRVSARHPRIDVLVRQARRVMHGAEYVAFDGAPPAPVLHGALAFPYAHATAPLRRLADRYVLDLVATLAVGGGAVTAAEKKTLAALPPVMAEATRKANQLERRVVDIAEAWTLRDGVGDTLPATVIDAQRGTIEVQVEEPPIRATLPDGEGASPPLGERVRVRVEGVDVEAGKITLALAR